MENPLNDTQLFRYLDGEMTSEEKKHFESLLASDVTAQKQVDEQRLLESTLKTLRLNEPSPAFTQLVMGKINSSTQGYSFSIRNGLWLLVGVMVVSLVATYLVQAGMFDATGALTAPKELGVISEYIRQPLPAIPINGKLIVNSIILINLALGFVILDRAVLRPYFERRMRHS
jgi:anti-sigma factor RsiW